MGFWDFVTAIILILAGLFACMIDLFLYGVIMEVKEGKAKAAKEQADWQKNRENNAEWRQSTRKQVQKELDQARKISAETIAVRDQLRRTAVPKNKKSGGL